MGKAAVAIELTAERAELEGLAGRRRTAQGLARRARIALAAADDMDNKTIAHALGADENTVGKWRRRFAEQRVAGLDDEPRPGAPRRIGDDAIAEMLRPTNSYVPVGWNRPGRPERSLSRASIQLRVGLHAPFRLAGVAAESLAGCRPRNQPHESESP